jgi:hypothetical protein
MKKIFLSTAILCAFSFSIILFEISCKKTANADAPSYTLPPATISKLGGVIPDGTTIAVDGNGKISTIGSNTQQNKILYGVYGTQADGNEIWTANYDGSEAQKINITLPSGLAIDDNNIGISPDHKTIFFSVFTPSASSGGFFIYSCNIDGSNVKKVINGGGNGDTVGIAY